MKRLMKTADNTKEQIYKSIHDYIWEDVTEEDIKEARTTIKKFMDFFAKIDSIAREAYKDFEKDSPIFKKILGVIIDLGKESDANSFPVLENLSYKDFSEHEIFENWTIDDLASKNESNDLLYWFNEDIKNFIINKEEEYKKEVDEVYNNLTDEEKQLAITDFSKFHDECI